MDVLSKIVLTCDDVNMLITSRKYRHFVIPKCFVVSSVICRGLLGVYSAV